MCDAPQNVPVVLSNGCLDVLQELCCGKFAVERHPYSAACVPSGDVSLSDQAVPCTPTSPQVPPHAHDYAVARARVWDSKFAPLIVIDDFGHYLVDRESFG